MFHITVLLHLSVLRLGELQQPGLKILIYLIIYLFCAADFKGLMKVCGLVWMRAMLSPHIIVSPALMTHTCTCCYLISRQLFINWNCRAKSWWYNCTDHDLPRALVCEAQIGDTEFTLLSGHENQTQLLP